MSLIAELPLASSHLAMSNPLLSLPGAMPDLFVTYLVHALVVAGCASLWLGGAARAGGSLSAARRAAVGRWALAMPLATAALAVFGAGGPEVRLASDPSPAAWTAPAGGAVAAQQTADGVPAATAVLPGSVSPVAGPGAFARADAGGRPWGLYLALLFALLGAAGLVRSLVREARARRALRTRSKVDDRGVLAAVEQLTASEALQSRGPVRIRVTESASVGTPMALTGGEIVLPVGFRAALPSGELKAALAHEIAHVVRRDPLSSGVARMLLSLTWYVPFQARLVRQIDDEAELAADRLATRVTGEPLALARSLERAASAARGGPLPVCATPMARRGASLVRRVEVLCRAEDPSQRGGRGETSALRMTLIAVPLVSALACAAPEVSVSETRNAVSVTASADPDGVYGPFHVTDYKGADAEPGERRFWLTLGDHGGLERLPTDGIITTDHVLSVLRDHMRKEVVSTGFSDLEVCSDRVVVEVPDDASFGFVLAWFQNFAGPDVGAYRVEIARAPASELRVVNAFLSHDVRDIPEEVEMTEEEIEAEEFEEVEWTGPVASPRSQITIDRVEDRTSWAFAGDTWWSAEDLCSSAGFRSQLAPGSRVVLAIDSRVTSGDVMDVLEPLQAMGVHPTFIGTMTKVKVGPVEEGR